MKDIQLQAFSVSSALRDKSIEVSENPDTTDICYTYFDLAEANDISKGSIDDSANMLLQEGFHALSYQEFINKVGQHTNEPLFAEKDTPRGDERFFVDVEASKALNKEALWCPIWTPSGHSGLYMLLVSTNAESAAIIDVKLNID